MRTQKTLIILGLVLFGTIAVADTYSQVSYIAPKIPAKQRYLVSIYIDEAARDYGIPADLLTAILAKESMFRVNAVNFRTQDYGIGQVNIKTIKALKLDKHRLLTDVRYSVRSSAKVLAWFKRYKSKESQWYCRYNIGTAKLTFQNINSCVKYAAGVQRYQFETLIAKEY